MEIIDTLMNEHKHIVSKMGAFSKGYESFCNDQEHIKYYLDFFRIYVDGYHHAKEEKALFPWMLEKNPALKNGPIGVMLMDHEQGRDLIKGTYLLLDKVEATNNPVKNQILSNMNQFFDHLYGHIQKEDNILYSIAESLNAQSKDGDEWMRTILKDIESTMGQEIQRFL